jgi:hypothetical protein
MGRAQRSHLLLLPKAENGLVAETLSRAAVLLGQRHPLVAGLLFSDLGAVGRTEPSFLVAALCSCFVLCAFFF